MSEIKRSNPTAGGDAPIVEVMKADCANGTISRSIAEPECADVVPRNAAAPTEEVAISTLNAQAESEPSVEATNSASTRGEEIANPDADATKTADITAEIVHAAAEDASVAEVEEQKLAEEIKSVVTVRDVEAPQPESANEEKVDNSKQNAKDNNQTYISKLETEVRKRTKERDSYRKKLEDTVAKLVALQASYDAIISHSNSEDTLQGSVEQLRVKLAQTALMYEERNRVVANQENQINALNKQVISLKEVVSITRDLLQIRNMEVKQLQAEVDNMEKKISEERDRHNVMISKMDAAMRLNADLKKEYETQLSLFQHLREKYDEKIVLLSGGKETLVVSTSE